MSGEHQSLVETAIHHWNAGNLPAYLELYGRDVVIHGYAGLEPGFDNVRKFYEHWWAAFPGSQLMVRDMLAAGDRVACRVTIEGVHRGAFQGMPASGKSFSIAAFTILRFVDGRCVERWSLADTFALLAQIGALGGKRS